MYIQILYESFNHKRVYSLTFHVVAFKTEYMMMMMMMMMMMILFYTFEQISLLKFARDKITVFYSFSILGDLEKITS